MSVEFLASPEKQAVLLGYIKTHFRPASLEQYEALAAEYPSLMKVVENAYFSISSSENPSDEAISSAIAAAFSATPAEEQPAVRADAERAVLAFSAATAATIAIGEGEGEGPVEGTTGEGEGEGEGPVEGTTGEGEGEGPVEDGTGEGEGPVAGESEYSYALDDELDMLEADFAAADAFAPAADDDAFGYAF